MTVSAAVLRFATSISCGRVQELIGELLDLVGERRGEQQVLPLLAWRQQRHDALDVGDEAHVEHPVGLVEHEDLDLAEVDALLLDVVEQASRRGDEDLDAGAHDRQLLLDVDAAEDDGRAQVGVLAVVRNDSSTWIASSRVGVRISARTGCRAGDGLDIGVRRAAFAGSAGAKPAVLPVPVWAPPITSLPARTTGMACDLDRGGRRVAGFVHGPQQSRAAGRARQSSLRTHGMLLARPIPLRDFRSRQHGVCEVWAARDGCRAQQPHGPPLGSGR